MSDWWSGAGDIKLIDCDDDEAAVRRYKVVFHLYGVTQSDIDEVIKEIDELGNEAVSDRVLDSADNQAHIAKLTADQVIYTDPHIFLFESSGSFLVQPVRAIERDFS